jgi:hypothetical protein
MVGSRFNVWNSVLGWTSILAAALLFAVLTLAPRIVAWEGHSRDQAEAATRIERLHGHVQQMESMVARLESDARLLEELAQLEWRVDSSEEERIAVDSSLQAGSPQVSRQIDYESNRPAAYIQWLRAVSVDESLRAKLMLAAMALSFIPLVTAPRDRRSTTALSA